MKYISVFVCASSLEELEAFVTKSDEILTQEVADDDYPALVSCIEQLSAVKERTATTDEMFPPLKETIELLRMYEQVKETTNIHVLYQNLFCLNLIG